MPIASTPTTTSPIPTPRRWVRRSISNDDLIASIDRVTNHLAECQLLVDSVLDQSKASYEFPTLQDHQAAATERPARPHRSRRPNSDMVIMATPEGRTVRRQPLPATGLRLANYEAPMEDPLKPYPFGLEGVGSAYQNTIHHLFADHVERDRAIDLYIIDPTKSDQPAPVVNMVNIHQLLDDSLHNVLEESPGDYSEGSTKTASSCPTFPLGFGGMISTSAMTALPRMAKLPTSAMLA